MFEHVQHMLKTGGGYTYNKTFAKRLQKCFRAVDFLRLCCGCENAVKMSYFTLTTSETFLQMFYYTASAY